MKHVLRRFIEVKLNLACPEVLKRVWPSMNQNRLIFIQMQTLPPSMHHKWKLLIWHAKQPIENHRGPAPNNNSNAQLKVKLMIYD